VRCDTLLVPENFARLKSGKAEIVPSNGVVLSKRTVTVTQGESVFAALQRATQATSPKTHMEFTNTPGYNSAYIEGIGNLYEFDCGPLSGWMYRVNGVFPNYGCSRHILKQGDEVEFLYTCDLGKDIGGGDVTGQRP